ncbi:MAG: YbjQ family protein [Planctomycetota bacterium]
MILVTTFEVPGREIEAVFGLVRGNTVRARHLGKDVTALFKNIVGGEVAEYTKLLAESREQAVDRMVEEARARGANAILGVRFSSSDIAAGAAELLVYGTAVRLRSPAGEPPDRRSPPPRD